MIKYVCCVKLQLENFTAWKLEHILRNYNEKEDALAAIVSSLPIKETVVLHVYLQSTSSITTNKVNKIDESCSSWMTPIVHYLSLREFPDNWVEAHKI